MPKIQIQIQILTLARTKKSFFGKEFSVSRDEFLISRTLNVMKSEK